MGTLIRPEISIKNKYWIDKHRHYELKHFCLQYPGWKRAYSMSGVPTMSTSMLEKIPTSNVPGDPTAEHVMRREYYLERIKLIERIALETDKYLHDYILRAVTENLSYMQLKTRFDIPCGRDMYYDRYRKFFWLLSDARK